MEVDQADQVKETVTNKELMKKILRMENFMENLIKEKQKPELHLSESNHDDKLLLVQGSKSIEELCLKGGLTAFETQSKLICDGCHHDSRVSQKAPLVMLKLLPPIFLFHLVQSFK